MESRQRLLAIVRELSAWQVFIALKFIEIIQILSPAVRETKSIEPFDPLEGFIGSAENGHLAKGIDQDLYE